MEDYIKITRQYYISMLDDRREIIAKRHWEIPDCIYNYVIELVEDGVLPGNDPERNSPSYFLDDIAVNSEWYTFDDYKQQHFIDDEEFYWGLKHKGFLMVFEDEQYILKRLGSA